MKISWTSFALPAIVLSAVLLALSAQKPEGVPASPGNPEVAWISSDLPLFFIPNRGQVDGEALFYAKASNYTLWLTREGLVFDGVRRLDAEPGPSARPKPGAFERDVVRLEFLGAAPDPRLDSLEPAGHAVSYFRGGEESGWRTSIPTSHSVLYRGLYPAVDLKIYGVEGRVEYDYVVKPGGKVADIRFAYSEAVTTSVDEAGDLVIETAFGELRHARPRCYQRRGGDKVEVAGRFRTLAENTFGFEVGAYDPDVELVIDPTVVYSTYLGGADYRDTLCSIAVDAQGSAYVTGWSASTNYPVKKAVQSKMKGWWDIVVSKVKPLGRELVYSTYLGGSDEEEGRAIAVDKTGAAYITGFTDSTDFPLKNPFPSAPARGDVVVCKIAPSGSSLVFSTRLGGQYGETGNSIAVGADGSVYVAGMTASDDFPLVNPVQSEAKDHSEAFVSKLNASGGALVYSTFLGGEGNDFAYDIVVDASGAAFVAGVTWAPDFPVKNALTPAFRGNGDGFLAKLVPAGNALAFSTFFGGAQEDRIYALALDPAGAVYIGGTTRSTDFPVKNAFQKKFGGGLRDAFAAKVSATGKGLLFSTYLGGSDMDDGYGIAVNAAGNVYLAGSSHSLNFPLKKSLKGSAAYGQEDIFLTKFERSGAKVVYSTFYGGPKYSDDRAYDVCLDALGQVYLTGITGSESFPLKNPVQKLPARNNNGFVLKMK